MDESLVIVLRPFQPENDSAMIYATWRNSAYYSAAIKPEIKNDVYFKRLTWEIGACLRTAQVRIACMQDCPIVILGYSVSTGTHLNWIYVKPEWRNRGIGSLLYPKQIETVTSQLTKIGLEICEKKKLIVKGDLEDE